MMDGIREDPVKEWRRDLAARRVAAMTDEQVMAAFGCCPTDPDTARAILVDQHYEDIVSEGLRP
jgi:hypothetical protein